MPSLPPVGRGLKSFFLIFLHVEQKPFRLTNEASSMWRPETQPWDRSIPWDGRPIKIDPVTGRPPVPEVPEEKAKPMTAEKGVQATEPPEVDECGIDLKRLCAAIATFEEASKRERTNPALQTPALNEDVKALQTPRKTSKVALSEDVKALQTPRKTSKVALGEDVKETMYGANAELQEYALKSSASTSASSSSSSGSSGCEPSEELELKERVETTRRLQELAERVMRGENALRARRAGEPEPELERPSRSSSSRTGEGRVKWKDYVWEIDTGGEDIQLEGIWMPFKPDTILKVEVNLGGEEFPLGPLEYTTDDTVEEACHDFLAKHRLRPLFEPLLQEYIYGLVQDGTKEASLDVTTLL
eukprot:symbB.v1.2.008993.t2/scaffold565.1/size187815/6